MSETNIGSDGLPKQSYKVDESFLAPFAAQVQFSFLDSTLSQSNQELKLAPLVAGYPKLPPADPDAYTHYNANEMAKISIAVLTAWGSALEEAAAEVRREINSPGYQSKEDERRRIAQGIDGDMASLPQKISLGDRYVWLNQLSGLVTAVVHIGTQNETIVPGVSQVEQSRSTAPYVLVQSLLLSIGDSAVVQGAGLLGAAHALDGLHEQSKIYQDTWQILNRGDDQASVITGWLSALWGVGLIASLLKDEKIKDVDKPDKKQDINFAKTHAEVVLGMINSNQFVDSIRTVLKSSKFDESRENHDALITKSKLALVSVALALLLKLEEGTTSEMEFAGFLKGEVDLKKNDPYQTASLKRAIIDEIKTLLAALEPTERDDILYNLLAYMGRNPSIEKMLDQQVSLEEIVKKPSFESQMVTQRPIDA